MIDQEIIDKLCEDGGVYGTELELFKYYSSINNGHGYYKTRTGGYAVCNASRSITYRDEFDAFIQYVWQRIYKVREVCLKNDLNIDDGRIYKGILVFPSSEGISLKYERLMKQVPIASGYLMMSDGTDNIELVHRIVAMTFIPNPNDYPAVNHMDGNKRNNNVSNLEWCTYSHNIRHAIDNGLMNFDPRYRKHKLTWEDVQEIRKTYQRGSHEYGTTALARKYGVTQQNISDICNFRVWNVE